MHSSAAYGLVAILALTAGTGCDAIKKLVGPRLEKPLIGTRSSAVASLDKKDTAKNPKYLGCDIKYFNMPAGSKIRLQWHHYLDEDGKIEDDDESDNNTKWKDQSVTGNGVINAYLQSVGGDFAPGVYECRWEAIADKKVDGAEQFARIKVGDLSDLKKKKGAADDDDDAPKKKKKPSSDDDE
jgi:hypothetical protein